MNWIATHRVLAMLLALMIAFIAFFLVYFTTGQPRTVGKVVASVAYDSREHMLTCAELPELATVRQVYGDHQDVVRDLQFDGSATRFGLDIETCPGKADIVVEYDTHQQRTTVEERLGDTFFGIPYRGYKR